MSDYGEQSADTDGLAAQGLHGRPEDWLGPDGLMHAGAQHSLGVAPHNHTLFDPGHTYVAPDLLWGTLHPQVVEWSERSDPTSWSTTTDASRIADLEARIARKEAANEALFAKLEATMLDMRSLQALADERQIECKRLSDLLTKVEEEKSREAVVTDSEKAADQMRQDILGGKIDKAGRQVVRDACDKMDAPKTGRDASNDALGNISRRGGW